MITDDHLCDSQWPYCKKHEAQLYLAALLSSNTFTNQDVHECLKIAASRADLQAASRLSCEAQSARLALHEHLYSAVVAANGGPLQVFNGLFQQGPYSAQGLNPKYRSI